MAEAVKYCESGRKGGKRKTKPKVKEKLHVKNEDNDTDLDYICEAYENIKILGEPEEITECSRNDDYMISSHGERKTVCSSLDCSDPTIGLPKSPLTENLPVEYESSVCEANLLVSIIKYHTNGDSTMQNVDTNDAMQSVDTKGINYQKLNSDLNIMKPFLHAQSKLKEICDSDNIADISYAKVTPSAPSLNQNDQVLEHASKTPKNKCIGRSVIQRCLDVAEQMSVPEVQHHQSALKEKIEIKPFSEVQLSALYNNLQLEEKDNVILAFLNSEKNIAQHEFYEIVLNYLRARTNLIGTDKDIQAKQNDYERAKAKVWVFEERTTTEEGTCEDDQLVTVNCTHEIASYQPNMTDFIAKQLKQIRESVFDSYTLHVYVAEMSKLQVENYLQSVTTCCREFTCLPRNTPVQCSFSEHCKDIGNNVRKLKECISILFSFIRRNVKDVKFVRDNKTWLSELIAVLLRVANAEDHIFLLCHILRCPAGVGEWASVFLQVVPPDVQPDQDALGSLLLDHLITVLSILLQPVKERDHFLRHYRDSTMSEGDEDANKDSVWIVVDSSGEDEEDSAESWHYFNENDLIQLLNQIPFEAMYKHILLIESNGEECLYSVEKASHHSSMKLFAFCTRLLKLFEDGLKTYSHSRYKGVVKRLSRLIRHTVHYVTDHWRNYKEHLEGQCQIMSTEDQAMSARIQVEYDEFFENAVKAVFLSPRRGAWQFLAVIPYTCVSLPRLYKIAYKLHVGYKDECGVNDSDDWPSVLTHSDTRGRFHDQLIRMGDCESYYLLTALANMAVVRTAAEREFIDAIVCNIFYVAFVNEDTREKLNRTGRDLFLTIASAHSFTLSTLLTELQEKLSSVGSLSIYLFRFLVLDDWSPTAEDLQCLSYWLLYTPPPSLENQLSRIVLSKLNWGMNKEETSLILPKHIQERVALLVVEVSLKISGKTGQGNLIAEGVKQVTSAVYAPSSDQVLMKWCWSMLNQLHLHQLDQPALEVQRVLSNPSALLMGVGDLSTSPALVVLKKGITSKHPLALFASLLMSSWGHSVPEIYCHCAESLEIMVRAGFSEYALTVLHLITPFFFGQHEELISDSKFMSTVQEILSADQTYVNLAKSYITSDHIGSTLQHFGDLIIEQLTYCERYNFNNPSTIVTFWVYILTTVPNWRCNSSILKLLDIISQFALCDLPSWQNLKELFKEQRKVVSGEAAGTLRLSSLLTWVSSSIACPRSLLVKTSAAEVPWFALAVLTGEAQEEIESGVWKGIVVALHADPAAVLDNVVRDVCGNLGIDAIPVGSLSIYRLGQQILDLPVDHPALPLTVQIYMTLHLTRTPPQPGQYDCNSVILRFFEGFINRNFLRRIKSKISELVCHWERQLAQVKTYEKESKESETVDITTGTVNSKFRASCQKGSYTKSRDKSRNSKNNKFETSRMTEKKISKYEYLMELTSTLQGMSAWLDETRLYETGLYIPALPPKLLPEKLLLVFQESWDLWPELIHSEFMNDAVSSHVKNWKKHRSYGISTLSPSSSASSSPIHSDSEDFRRESQNPTESILRRLKEYDTPKPPPPVPVLRQKKISVPVGGVLDKDSVLYDIERYTGMVVNHAHTMMLRSKEMCALDCVYTELLPNLWTNQTTKTVMSTTCKPNRTSKNKACTGAASIVVEYSEKRLNEGVSARIEQNREQHQNLMNSSMQTPPLQLCEAAVHLESLVNLVVHWHKRLLMQGNEDQIQSVISYGRELFYQLIQLTSEDTNSYPPAKQLITSCADTLGQEFLRSHLDCQESLVLQVLHSTPQLGVLLSPHFTPMVTSIQTYLNMYSCLSPHIAAQPDLCFMLLSKFEMEMWLREKRVSCSDRSQLINTIGASLTSLLSLGEETTIMCLELYRVHLRALLNFNFPEHFAQILSIILDISLTTSDDCGDVGQSIWYDLLNTLSKGICEFKPDMETSLEIGAIRLYCQRQTLTSPQMIKDTLRQLSTHFVHFRLQFGLYGLYPKYKQFVKPITLLLALVSHSYIITANLISRNSETELLIREIWENLEGVWAAWIAPLGGKARESLPQWIQELTSDKRIFLPWTPGDTTGPANAMAMYSATIAFFHETFVGSRVLSLYLEYYTDTYATALVKEHILGVVHPYMSSLPWHHLSPSLKDVEIISKIINEYLPECHSFIGNIFIQIPWNKVVKNFKDKSCTPATTPRDTEGKDITDRCESAEKASPSSSLVKLHLLLLNILVRISLEPSVRQSGLLHPLLLMAESFEWKLVDAKNYESVINWFVMSCDPRIVLNMQNRNPIDVSIIRLLHVSGGYTRDTPSNPHRSGPLKRRLLVRALCRLVTTVATRHKALLSARKPLFADTFAILLTQMEDTVVEGLPEVDQFAEGVALSSEAIALIGGGASPPVLQEVCRDSLLSWLRGSHPSTRFLLPLAASISKGVLQLQHRSPLMEQSLRSIFDHADVCGENDRVSWASVMPVLSFPLTNPLPLLTVAAQENSLFLVFAHTRWRLQRASKGDHPFILANLMELLSFISPLEESCEAGLLLVLHEIINLIEKEVSDGPSSGLDYQCLWKHCKTLLTYLATWGEDRASQGILAAIGFGRKSSLSVRMRLICKCLYMFIAGQLLALGFFCSINEHLRSVLEIDQSPVPDNSCDEALKALHQVMILRNNSSYAEQRHAIDFAISFTQENCHSILDTKYFLRGLVQRVYPDEHALKFMTGEVETNSIAQTDNITSSSLGSSRTTETTSLYHDYKASTSHGRMVLPSIKSAVPFEAIPETDFILPVDSPTSNSDLASSTSELNPHALHHELSSTRDGCFDSAGAVAPSAPPLFYDDD